MSQPHERVDIGESNEAGSKYGETAVQPRQFPYSANSTSMDFILS